MPGLFHRDAVCNGRDGGERLDGAVVQRICHRGRARRLNAVNFHARVDALDGKRHARDEPAPADGHHDGVHVGQLLQNFKADGPLARDDVLVVEGVDEGVVVLFLKLERAVVSVVVDAGHKADLRPVRARRFHFGDGRALGQADDGGDTVLLRRKRHALRVVARRAGDDAVRLRLVGELRNFIVRAPQLEGARPLQVLRLEVDLSLRGDARADDGGSKCRLMEDALCVFNFIECKHTVALAPPAARSGLARLCA